MHLETLSLVNFKNYKQVEIALDSGVNCFVGNNGAGKTNVLDAVHYLSMCKSYLNPIDTQNICFDASFFVVQGKWNRDANHDQIYCAVKKGSKKVFKKNKVEYEKLSDHIGRFPVVMISPYDRNLILEGSEVRRKWMDGIIAQFSRPYLEDLIKYGKVLDQRNALLKNMADFGFFNAESIEVWDMQLAGYGKRIFEQRQAFLNAFIPVFKRYYNLISNQAEEVDLRYKSQLHDASFQELLESSQRDDHRKQYTTVGVHKDDLIFTIKDQPIKKFGSQGQQKSFLIALRLSQFEWLQEQLNVKPVLLLDDIFDKLDNSRVQRLMQMVSDQDFGQVLVTDTDLERVKAIFDGIAVPFRAFMVNDNEIKEHEASTLNYTHHE